MVKMIKNYYHQKINPTQVKQIIPIFKYEKKALNIIDIIINGKNINDQ